MKKIFKGSLLIASLVVSLSSCDLTQLMPLMESIENQLDSELISEIKQETSTFIDSVLPTISIPDSYEIERTEDGPFIIEFGTIVEINPEKFTDDGLPKINYPLADGILEIMASEYSWRFDKYSVKEIVFGEGCTNLRFNNLVYVLECLPAVERIVFEGNTRIDDGISDMYRLKDFLYGGRHIQFIVPDNYYSNYKTSLETFGNFYDEMVWMFLKKDSEKNNPIEHKFVFDYGYDGIKKEFNSYTIREIENPTREGYIFLGWLDENGFSVQSPFVNFDVNKKVTNYVAKWVNEGDISEEDIFIINDNVIVGVYENIPNFETIHISRPFDPNIIRELLNRMCSFRWGNNETNKTYLKRIVFEGSAFDRFYGDYIDFGHEIYGENTSFEGVYINTLPTNNNFWEYSWQLGRLFTQLFEQNSDNKSNLCVYTSESLYPFYKRALFNSDYGVYSYERLKTDNVYCTEKFGNHKITIVGETGTIGSYKAPYFVIDDLENYKKDGYLLCVDRGFTEYPARTLSDDITIDIRYVEANGSDNTMICDMWGNSICGYFINNIPESLTITKYIQEPRFVRGLISAGYNPNGTSLKSIKFLGEGVKSAWAINELFSEIMINKDFEAFYIDSTITDFLTSIYLVASDYYNYMQYNREGKFEIHLNPDFYSILKDAYFSGYFSGYQDFDWYSNILISDDSLTSKVESQKGIFKNEKGEIIKEIDHFGFIAEWPVLQKEGYVFAGWSYQLNEKYGSIDRKAGPYGSFELYPVFFAIDHQSDVFDICFDGQYYLLHNRDFGEIEDLYINSLIRRESIDLEEFKNSNIKRIVLGPEGWFEDDSVLIDLVQNYLPDDFEGIYVNAIRGDWRKEKMVHMLANALWSGTVDFKVYCNDIFYDQFTSFFENDEFLISHVYKDDVYCTYGKGTATFIFNTDGGNEIPNLVTKEIDKLPTPLKSGKYFAGWYDENGEKYDFVHAKCFYEDVTIKLTAHWSDTLVTSEGVDVRDYGVVGYKENYNSPVLIVNDPVINDSSLANNDLVNVIVVGEKVINIRFYAFANLNNCKACYLTDRVEYIDPYIFEGTSNKTDFVVIVDEEDYEYYKNLDEYTWQEEIVKKGKLISVEDIAASILEVLKLINN